MSDRVIAERMSKLDASGIRKVFDLAQNMENPVNLSIGQPDFDIPDSVKQAAVEGIQGGLNRYTPTQGIEELRQALLERVCGSRGVQGESALITSGVSGGLLLAMLVLVDPGDEVLVPDPYFVLYKHLVNLAGGVPVFVDTYPDFKLTRERIEPHLTEKTKLLLVNAPANPTGTVPSAEQLKSIAEMAKERDLIVISDEIYSHFSYDGPCPSIATYYGNTLLLDGFSKSHAMTGWRLGYAVGPAEIVAEMTKLQQFSFVCAPSFAQHAGLKALDVDTTPYVKQYQKKRDMLCDGLKDKYELVKPEGAFYLFPKTPWGTDHEFVAKAIENNLLIIPGSVFSEQTTHFRIVYAATDETIERGIEILNKLA